MSSWKESLQQELLSRAERDRRAREDRLNFPLIEQAFDADDVLSMTDVILSGQLTMSKNVKEFEAEFAKKLGVPYAVMVNSGSSANLLAFAAACNHLRSQGLKAGDEILIPAVCWSTSVWPLFQFGLVPVFVDVVPETLNIDVQDLKKKLTVKTRGLLAVHILGNCGPIDELMAIAQEHNLVLIEDTCESLGSRYNDRNLGTFGDFGTFSFYYSHHMTTGEGGMVICKTQEDVDLLRCLRAHGWTRELSQREAIERQHADVDSRFLFVNLGYNLRPMEVQAALGLSQLKKLDKMNSHRIENHNLLVKALRAHPLWNEQFSFIQALPGVQPVWFGFTLLLREDLKPLKAQYLSYLSKHGVENRPVVSGNFVRQPALKDLGLKLNPSDFPGAEQVDSRGFFIGVHTHVLQDKQIQFLINILLNGLEEASF